VSNGPGQLFVVATPIGNRDDISRRAVEILLRVDRIAAEDTRHSRRLLDYLGVDRPMMALHEHNEMRAVERVLACLNQGESLALISDAGTPLINDPGFPLVRACREAGIRVVPVPGASALIAALSVSGLPTDRFRFEGFLPRRRAARIALLETLRDETATLVFYESSHRVVDALADLTAVFGEDREAVVARELTKLHETVKSAPLGELSTWMAADENQRKGEFVLLLGGAPETGASTGHDADTVLAVLLEELPLKQAASLAARITGGKKNALYQRALAMSRV